MSIRSSVPLEASPYPTAFPLAAATAPQGLPYSEAGSDTYRCEIIGIGHFQKEGLVREISSGRTWRLSADEGKYLRGTDMAPAPLMHWGAGLHADAVLRIAARAREHGLALRGLFVRVRQGFASKGSFVKGEAVGLVYGLSWLVDLDADGDAGTIARAVREALAASPAVDAMLTPREGHFALYLNGRPVEAEGLHPSANRETDPLAAHASAFVPTDEAAHPDILARLPGTGTAGMVLQNDSTASVGWHMQAEGALDPATGLVHSTVGFPEAGAASRWTLVSDGSGRLAPTPLAYFSVGTAFCYHTQFCRYIDVRRLPLASTTLVQTTSYTVAAGAEGARGTASAFDTHVFLNGDIDESAAAPLPLVAARTCYAHRAMETAVEMKVEAGRATA
ncbi:hypothetical protein EGT29_14440 [Pigmentiphaga sp. H8]|uniref:hypothetical protein n=1 Tax=Pigmentiphaga sp. H8 TaxID=2488560 RepID=UPI000F5A62FD|nr:hypothetical protein [Pigmentiphaga sp. H8]AZG08962.1 hypothetical protein EGT29_14440 [Pigmentiphaga sp. H8]